MDALETHADVSRALRRYLAHAEGKLTTRTFDDLEKLADSPSNVDRAVRTAELLYARREELDDEGRTLVAQLASWCGLNGFWNMGVGNRGGLMAQAMRRDMGHEREEGQPPFVAAENDPAPDRALVLADDVDRDLTSAQANAAPVPNPAA